MEETYFKIHLPDGRVVDILTTQGADTLLSVKPVATMFIDSSLGEADTARKRLESREISKQELHSLQEVLVRNYLILANVANNASEGVFRAIGQSQIDRLLVHTSKVFSELSTNIRWTKTGVLEKHNQELLESLICFMKHPIFVDRVMSGDLLSILATLCAGRQGTEMPCPMVTETILGIVNNFRVCLLFANWEAEQIFKRIEASGLLAQVLRCITQPSPNPDAIVSHLAVMDELMICQSLVRKKLKPGEPTGDILACVLAGNNGFKGTRDERVMTRLRNLHKMACVLNQKTVLSDGTNMAGNVCRCCGKADFSEEFQASLLVCR